MGARFKTDRLLDGTTIKHVLLAGLVFRLLAVIFSKGYAFHDDHFEMAELVQRWREGYSFLWTSTDVHVFSLIYPGFLYLVFEACHAVGLDGPEQILFVLRLIHALFSLLAIWYGYKLVLRISDNHRVSIIIAACMALLWIFPFMAVRNLREFVCIPFLLGGSYYIADKQFSYRSLFLSSLFFALAFAVRLQVLFIPLGIGLYLIFKKTEIKKAVVFGVFLAFAYFLTQGLFDFIYYGNPFASVMEYLRFNSDEANIAIQPRGPWHQYIGTVAGIVFGFPFLLLLIGYFHSWKIKAAGMFLVGSLLFFLFHSYYSNKQERFILPFIPYFIILGSIGYWEFYKLHHHRHWFRSATRFSIAWFVALNIVGLFILTFTYTKRSRVEAMLYLRGKNDLSNIIMEGEHSYPRPPLFYLGRQVNFYSLTLNDSIPVLTDYIPAGPNPPPNYLVMSGEGQLEKRIGRLKKLYPDMRHEVDIRPGFVDNLAYRLNPRHNDNETLHIYKIKASSE